MERRQQAMSKTFEIPFWEKYTLSIEGASRYFRIGEKKIRKLTEENPDADFILMNGSRIQIKRHLFEQYIDAASVV